MRDKTLISGLALALILMSVYLLISLFTVLGGNDSLIRWSLTSFVGSFLYSGFSWAAFAVPLYLAAAAVLLIGKKFGRHHILVLTSIIFPFLTVSLFFKVAAAAPEGRVPLIIIELLGRVGGSAVLVLAAIFEVILIIRFARSHNTADLEQEQESDKVKLLPSSKQ
ncbi:MAG: hypothetical protein HN368_03360, partial [Spirochaetales bacterium]|nr:hypothetical protein [Spirochaetales bacterium]